MLTYTEISFPGLGISLNPSTGITLGSFSIRWYGLVIALGLCLAVQAPFIDWAPEPPVRLPGR